MHTNPIHKTIFLPLLAGLCLLCGCSGDESAAPDISLPPGGLQLTPGTIYTKNSDTEANTRADLPLTKEGATLSMYLMYTLGDSYALWGSSRAYVHGVSGWTYGGTAAPLTWLGPRKGDRLYLSYPHNDGMETEAAEGAPAQRAIMEYSEADDHWIGTVDLSTGEAQRELVQNGGMINNVALKHTLARLQIRIRAARPFTRAADVTLFQWKTKTYRYIPIATSPYGEWTSVSSTPEVKEKYKDQPLTLPVSLSQDYTKEIVDLLYPPEAMMESEELSFRITISGVTYDLTQEILTNVKNNKAGQYMAIEFTLSSTILKPGEVRILPWDDQGEQNGNGMKNPLWPEN